METSVSSIRAGTYLAAYFVLWTTVLVLLRTFEGFEIGEALAALAILGVIFPALALLTTRRMSALPFAVHRPQIETAALLVYLAVVAWLLVLGFDRIAHISVEPWRSVAVLGVKLMEFVVVPAVILMKVGDYKTAELIPFSLGWRALRPALWMSAAVLLMQSLLGHGLHDIREAQLPMWLLAAAAPLSFAWLMVEVGVVEEFFFRVLLQERLAAVLRSPWGGLVVAALLFGLVHAPGFYLRTAATQEALGAHPSLLMAVGYSIVMTSLTGLFLGILWMRTKNLAVLVIVHAAGDLLPNLVPWIKAFH
ncbi:MAG: CPBP family intramembrane glutamic endopeptidase [Terracidiphilus sp.]|jgi:membrane protease YdiL (CAAX protease family)